MGKPFKHIIIKWLIIITIPLVLLLFINNIYSIKEFNQKIYESNMRTAAFIGNSTFAELERVESSFSKQAAGNVDFITLSGNAGQLQAHLSSQALHTQLKAVMASYNSLEAFFIYSVPSSVERDLFADGYKYDEKQAIRDFIRKAVETNSISYSDGWVSEELNGRGYLFRFFGGRGNYIVAMMSVEALISDVKWETDHGAVALMIDGDNKPLNNKDFIESSSVELNSSFEDYYISGNTEKYMIIGKPVGDTDYTLVLIVGGAGYFDSLNPIQITLLILSLLAAFAVPVMLAWLKNSVVKPLEKLTVAMEEVKEGHIEARVETDSNINEFNELGDTFNTMMTEINDLKIETYEKEIETERAQLMYLQLQIRPHFFLNCLKSLYALAEKKDFERIQKMILAFSNHIRYIFRDSVEFVPLKRELEHIKNYIEIQKISSAKKPKCIVDVDEKLLNLAIPPLSVQTFVENSIKHESDPDKGLEIRIKAKIIKSEEGAYANISVSDNGSGFSEEMLKEVNSFSDQVYKSKHVGLNNIKQRLKFIYGDGVMLAFFNDEIGSVSEILIPIDKEGKS